MWATEVALGWRCCIAAAAVAAAVVAAAIPAPKTLSMNQRAHLDRHRIPFCPILALLTEWPWTRPSRQTTAAHCAARRSYLMRSVVT